MGIRKMPPDGAAPGQRQAGDKTASSCRKAIPDGMCTGERHVAAGAGSVPSRFRLPVSKTACARWPAQSAATMTVLCNELLRARQNPQMTLTCCPAPVILRGKIPDRIFCCRPAFAYSSRRRDIRLSCHDIFSVLSAEAFQEADVPSGHRDHPVTGADF